MQTRVSIFLHILIASTWLIVIWSLGQIESWQAIWAELGIQLVWLGTVGVLFIMLSLMPKAWQTPTQQPLQLSSSYIHLLALSVLLLLFGTLYHQVLDAWWTFDDPNLLHYLDVRGPWVAFYDPELKYNFYTPMQTLSWWIDYQLFGLEPHGFYWHHFLSLSIVMIAAYWVLSLFISPLISTAIISIFIVAIPTVEMVHYLMVRHYIEGLAFALLATGCYVYAVTKGHWGLAIFGSLLYFLAALNKELYVPLVVGLLWLPIGTFTIRSRYLVPYAIFAAIYTLIRMYMLGEETLAGYANSPSTRWQDIVYFPHNLAEIMGWTQVWQWLPIIGILLVWIYWLLRKPVTIGLPTLVWLACVLLPLIPILWRLEYLAYYLFVVGLFVALGIGLALHYLAETLKQFSWHTAILSGLALLLLLVHLLPAQLYQIQLKSQMENWREQGMVLLHDNTPRTILLYDYHVAESLIYLRDEVLQKTNGIAWCRAPDCACAAQYPGYTAKYYSDGQWHTHAMQLEGCNSPAKP